MEDPADGRAVRPGTASPAWRVISGSSIWRAPRRVTTDSPSAWRPARRGRATLAKVQFWLPRTDGEPPAFAAAVRRGIRAVDGDVAATRILIAVGAVARLPIYFPARRERVNPIVFPRFDGPPVPCWRRGGRRRARVTTSAP
jgi:hypothetical protein